jgi:hypothetical protein
MGRNLWESLLQPLVNWRQQTDALIDRIAGGWSTIRTLVRDGHRVSGEELSLFAPPKPADKSFGMCAGPEANFLSPLQARGSRSLFPSTAIEWLASPARPSPGSEGTRIDRPSPTRRASTLRSRTCRSYPRRKVDCWIDPACRAQETRAGKRVYAVARLAQFTSL